MKKSIIIIIITLHASLFTLHTVSQSCLPEGIIFTTQAQIDSFQINYPNCSHIEGIVEIGGDIGSSGSDICNLNGLDEVEMIGGSLWIGELYCFWGGQPFVIGNPLLTSLNGLNSLTHIGGSLTIFGDNQLTDLSGLESLTFLGGDLIIGGSLSLSYIISGNPILTSLTGLNSLTTIHSEISICGNDSLTTLTGLDGLTSAHGLRIQYNQSLQNLNGLENLNADSLEYLFITNNDVLSTCDVQFICDYLASPSAYTFIYNNAFGCNNPGQVIAACESVNVPEFNTQHSTFNIDIYPNPTGGIVDFRFSMVDFRCVSLKIYDVHGREVAKVLDKKLPVGEHIVRHDVSGLPPGLYYYVLRAGNQEATGKMIRVE